MATNARSIAILAGGRATRFGGQNKGALIVDGRTILARQLAELAPLAGDLMLVGARAQAPHGLRAIADIVPGCGPLGGIHAALSEARGSAVLVVGCDMPYVTAAFAAFLFSCADEGDALVVVPRSGDRLHPLCAVYSRACVDAVARLLAERTLALHTLIDSIPARVVGEEEMLPFGAPSRLLANVNTPAEYAGLEALQDHKR